MTEKMISELEERSIEFTLSENKDKNRKKINRVSGTGANICVIKAPQIGERMEVKSYSKK